MKSQQRVWKFILSLILLSVAVGTMACSEEPTGPRAWIDSPRDGTSVPIGAPVSVISHAFAGDGIAEVVLSINGEAYRRSPPTSTGTFFQFTQEWLPPKEGDYTLEVKTYAKSGAVSPAALARVHAVSKGTVTPVRPITAIITPIRISVTPVTPSALSDLAIVSVEAMIVGYKGDIALCKPRVVYRNAGTVPVPNDYVIQLTVNGTPQMAMTRGAGFGVGGTSEAIFDYLFEGAPYIGVNLDSTNTVTESSETNNAFAEIRNCSGTPSPGTSTITPTPTRTPTIGIPLPPPPSGCSGTPNIASFSASPSTIAAGNSATLSWGAVTNADSVTIEPGIGGVSTPGSATVTPNTTTTYTLTARCGSNTITRQTTVNVTVERTRTFTPTTKPDTQGPPAPTLVSPRGTIDCSNNVTLDWNPVSDPSGIKQYIVKWVRNDGQTGGTVTTNTQTTISVSCGRSYTWSVQAVDNLGNTGATASTTFTIRAGLY